MEHCKTVFLASALAMLLGVQAAHTAPSTETQLCASMKNAIKKNGTLIRRSKGRNIRFAYHGGFCDHFETLEWTIVRARDGECYLKTCQEVAGKGFR